MKPHGDHPHRPRPAAARRPHRRRRAHRSPPHDRGDGRGLQQRDRGPRRLRHGHLAHQGPAHRTPPRLDPAPGGRRRPPSSPAWPPTLHWRAEAAGWDLLGFEALTGHHADYAPGSPDLPEVAALLRRLGETPCPGIELRHAEQRLEHYAAHPDDLRYFAGPHLLHTDLNHANVLVDDHAPQGDRARLVDWAWATRGTAWLDAGYWIIWLIAAGHTPASAERWAAEIPSWHTAPAEGITAFATANHNLWSEISNAEPDPWTQRLATAAATWHAHRRAG